VSTALHKARQLLRTAQRAKEEGDTWSAANRAYFVAFEVVRALLRSVSEELVEAKTHHGIEQAFNRHLVRAGYLPKSLAKEFAFFMELRWHADYEIDSVPTSDEAERGIAAAENIFAAAENFFAAGKRDP
jgi:uncharacterized protein (UPF0332 family)